MTEPISVAQTRIRPAFLWKVSFIAGLGGLLYGYDMGVIAAALLFVQTSFRLSTQMQQWVVSIVLVGAMVGAVTGGSLADRAGRRITLLSGSVLFIVGSLMAFLAPDVYLLIAARIVLGVAIGFTSVAAPVFVSELSPPQSRGKLIGLYQFALTAGIALADVVGYWLAPAHAWRAMFGLGALPAALFLLLLLSLPETPRWLYERGRNAEAERVLASYTDAAGAQQLLHEIHIVTETAVERRWSSLWSPSVRRLLFTAVGFTVLQQVTGINTIIYYGPKIFALAGITSSGGAILETLIVAVTNMLATIVALLLVDRWGRKPLLYFGVGGMTCSLAVLSYAFHTQALGPALGRTAILCLIGFIACFALSMGPIAWILVSELFPLKLRGRGVAAASLGSGISNFVVSLTFLSLIHAVGNAMTFAIYGFFCVVTLIFVRFVVPETKGRELEQISAAPQARDL